MPEQRPCPIDGIPCEYDCAKCPDAPARKIGYPKRWREYCMIIAVEQLAKDYHNGMSSRGYRIQCRCSRLLATRHPDIFPWRPREQSIRQSAEYQRLLPLYKDKM